jgi:hypothetical protein
MKLHCKGRSGVVLLLSLAVRSFVAVSFAQQPQAPSSGQTTIHVQTSLVLVDLISQDPKNGLPVRDFKSGDFRVLNDGEEVPITTFDAGTDTRPVIIWLVVICNEGGLTGGSAEFAGRETMFRPAFDQLDKRDTVGVAHWCDNGEAQLDLSPTEDHDRPLRVLAETIKPIPFHVGGDSDAVGEVAFRKTVRLIIQDANRRNPQPLPVIVFLHGDHTGQPHRELDEVVNDFLETSGIVFGIKDSRAPRGPLFYIGEVAQIEHYIARHTGGQYFTAPPSGYAEALKKILAQLHSRYELGFAPPAIDGKRHAIKVELTKQARAQHKGVRLRFRPEYIAVSEPPEWAR